MAIGWYIIPYKRDPVSPNGRYPAIDDYTAEIESYGGYWSETEVLGNHCIVKVRAPVAVLNALAAVDGFQRLPKDRLDDPLSDLSIQALRKIRDMLEALGYPLAEIKAKFGNNVALLGNYTLRDVLLFVARRRLKPRYDAGTGEIILDGPEQPVKPLEYVDAEVAE